MPGRHLGGDNVDFAAEQSFYRVRSERSLVARYDPAHYPLVSDVVRDIVENFLYQGGDDPPPDGFEHPCFAVWKEGEVQALIWPLEAGGAEIWIDPEVRSEKLPTRYH